MRNARAIRRGLVLCGTLAGVGCGTRFVGHVSRDGEAPVVEAGVVEAGAREASAHEASSEVGVDGGGGATADARPDGPPLPPPNLPPVCTVDGWCWTHPLPSGDRFVDAFKVAADEVWLVGAAGTIVRIAGGELSTIPPPTSALAAIWASGPNDVWVGGPDGQYHWDGQGWTYRPLEINPVQRGVSALWGCAANDIWAVGTSTARWDGSRWASLPVPSDVLVSGGGFRTVWGSACDDVWTGSLDAVGAGAIYHFDGSIWTRRDARPATELAGIGRTHVWSLAQGRLFHSNGVEAGALVSDGIVSLSPAGPSAVAVMNDAHEVSLLTGGGATPLAAPAPTAASTLRGWAANDLWGIGALGTAAHWNGASWERHLPAWLLSGGDATRVTGSGPDDVWAIAGATLLRRDGAGWQVALTAGDVGGQILDVWAPGPDEVWVLGSDNLVHRRVGGGDWTTMNPLGGDPTSQQLRAISGTGPKDVWVLRGPSTLMHWDGEGWVGREAVMYRGGGLNALEAIWAAAPDDLWAVGDAISHWSNGAWVQPPAFPSNIVGINAPYVAVAGTGPNDVHFLFGSGYVAKATSNNLTLVEELSATTHPVALAAAVPTGVWAVFDDPVGGVSRIYRLGGDPDAGAAPKLVGPAGLNAIWSAPDGTLWAAGKGGSLLRRAPAP